MTSSAERQRKYYNNHREDCKQQLRNYYKNHRKEILAHHQKVNEDQRLQCLIHYSGNPPHCQCPNCTETEIKFLSIDHINGHGNEHKRQIGGSDKLYRWLIKNNFPEGFQILCYNCNLGKARNNGVCPHITAKAVVPP